MRRPIGLIVESLQLNQWQHFYSHKRLHSALGGRAPMKRFEEREELIPAAQDVAQQYDPKKEPLFLRRVRVTPFSIVYRYKQGMLPLP